MTKRDSKTDRECLFGQTYPDDDNDAEVFFALYRYQGRLLFVASQERGGHIEIQLSADDARGLLDALLAAVPPKTETKSDDGAESGSRE